MEENKISIDDMVWLTYFNQEIRNSTNTICTKICIDNLNKPLLNNREKYCLRCCTAKYNESFDIIRKTMIQPTKSIT